MRTRMFLALSAITAVAGTVPRADAAITWHRVTGQVEGVMLATATDPAVSDDGRVVAVAATFGRAAVHQIAAYDHATRRLSLVTVPASGSGFSTGDASAPAISGDGKLVLFSTTARDLQFETSAAGTKVYLRDLRRRQTRRLFGSIEAVTAGGAAITLSRDGRYAFALATANSTAGLISGTGPIGTVYRANVTTGAITTVSLGPTGAPVNADSSSGFAVSRDGRYVAFVGRLTATDAWTTTPTLYLRDVTAGRTTVVPTGALPPGTKPTKVVMDAAASVMAFRVANTTVTSSGLQQGTVVFSQFRVVNVRTGIVTEVGGSAMCCPEGNNWELRVSGNGRYVYSYDLAFPDDANASPFYSRQLREYNVSTGRSVIRVPAARCGQPGPHTTPVSGYNERACIDRSAPTFGASHEGSAIALATTVAWASDDSEGFVDVYLGAGR